VSPKRHQRDGARSLDELEQRPPEQRADVPARNVLRLTDGLWFDAGPESWQLEPLRLDTGEWAALVPAGEEPVFDPSGALARILTTLKPPLRGVVELLDKNVYQLEYRDQLRLRSRLGFVQGYGGLLSNRTLRDNVTLPVSVHGKLRWADEAALVNQVLGSFALDKVADLRPHEVDGATRWRTCAARALVLGPAWLVLEGIGDWEVDRGRGVVWTRFRQYLERRSSAAAICLSRQNPAFEAWFEEHGGKLVHYNRRETAPQPRSAGS
jgi:predicted ABC-type transport system involved in lysophospholipase L1 biosynthesis ATPase subunit